MGRQGELLREWGFARSRDEVFEERPQHVLPVLLRVKVVAELMAPTYDDDDGALHLHQLFRGNSTGIFNRRPSRERVHVSHSDYLNSHSSSVKYLKYVFKIQ